ncbi:MAG: Single-stranded nucleic acid binding R3H domain protein [Candidatus Woesebacteria bacterium GW2011_GWB1_41_10]|uniref:Single-stranded nucleic acid binding R3H domain protein n=1 Tax=Candidatus Woesebacteria bacterium GW2011_GWB1_41_10 TaxID=1618577 RepID=A0A0G0UE22_9BACT|nr:MAG: Single-stranded nucleic acid binding R3H domain protein [Candidatus Woesebacteria bacterium GW2011_GWB1_41_10]
MEEKTKTLKNLVDELFSLMGVSVNVDVSYDEGNEAFIVNIDGKDETGLLIGRKGETLSSIQTVLATIFKVKTGEWSRVLVNVGDYREKEEDHLKNLAENAASRAKETGEAQPLYNLKPGQRRIIHLYLANDTGIETKSVGEDAERYLLIKPKK